LSSFLDEHLPALLGINDEQLELLRAILAELKRPSEWGQVSELYNASWAAGEVDDYQFDGVFKSVAVYNRSAATVRFGFAPGTARRTGLEDFDLAARCWLVIPTRGSFVSIGGASAGTATILAFSTPQPPAGGVF
jgi:hypothetical protein